jgi:hypothetical protein
MRRRQDRVEGGTHWGPPLVVGIAASVCLCSFFLTPPADAAERVTIDGVLEAEVTDDFAHDSSTTTYSVDPPGPGKAVPVLPTEISSAESGEEVSVTGTMHEGALVGPVEGESSEASARALGPRKVAVLLLKFPGDPEEPWPPQETREKVFTGPNSANAFYQEESWG